MSEFVIVQLGGQVQHLPVRRHPRRKRLSLIVERNGEVVVAAPVRSKQAQLEKFVHTNSQWLEKQLSIVAARMQQLPTREYVQGEQYYLLGQALTLTLCKGMAEDVAVVDGKLCVAAANGESAMIKTAIHHFMSRCAQRHLTRRMDFFAAQIPWLENTPPLKLKRLKRAWGSCSSTGNVTLNPLLIKASPAAIDSVVVHELCHLRELNHSPRFYALMDEVLPAWRVGDRWLSEHTDVLLHE